jgi:hypothetical protein
MCSSKEIGTVRLAKLGMKEKPRLIRCRQGKRANLGGMNRNSGMSRNINASLDNSTRSSGANVTQSSMKKVCDVDQVWGRCCLLRLLVCPKATPKTTPSPPSSNCHSCYAYLCDHSCIQLICNLLDALIRQN